MLEQTDDAGNLLGRYATAAPSYYAPLLEFESPDGSQHYPLYDIIGTARRLADATGTMTDAYSLDAFGRSLGGWGSTGNPYRYGAAWGYLTDPSGLQQLGARFRWPEVGRFVQQDPIGDGMNWYAYAADSPTAGVDPEGLTAGTNAAFFSNWVSGALPTDVYYTNGSVEVSEMQASPGVAGLRNQLYSGGQDIVGTGSYDSKTAFFDTIGRPCCTDFQVGGWAGASVVSNGNGTITFQIDNTAGTRSFFYHAVPNRKGKTGPMHSVGQHFTWTEPARPGSWAARPRGPNGRGAGGSGLGGRGSRRPGGRGRNGPC